MEATDAGREGELIFRLVYDQCECKKSFERFWISSMEDAAIREGFACLRPKTEYDALYEAALCRERADWDEIGMRLAASRKSVGYTQEELGEITGLSIKTISAAENGHKAPRPENIVKVCECLSISTDYLLKGKDSTLKTIAKAEKIATLSAKQKFALQKIVEDFLSAFD